MRRLLLAYLLLLTDMALAQQPASHSLTPRAQQTAPAAKELAYYCASGNTVKYHSSPTCRGLTRCSAKVKPLALNEAQSQMNPCKICY